MVIFGKASQGQEGSTPSRSVNEYSLNGKISERSGRSTSEDAEAQKNKV